MHCPTLTSVCAILLIGITTIGMMYVCTYITYGISTVSCYIPSTGTQFSKVLDFSLFGLGALLNGAHPAAVRTFELPDN